MGPDTGLNCIRTKEVVKGPADSFVRLREKVGRDAYKYLIR